MPLIEKEVISPGTYFYTDVKTGDPRKLVVTPELTKYWLDQGKAMLDSGLTVPVPYEHDFNAHPMTPKAKMLSNAGEVNKYYLKDFDDPIRGRVKDALFSTVNIQDPDLDNKIGKSIRWTSPWFNSFTDGNGKQWNNVISHLALTLRPRITAQQPFGSIAAALSLDTGKLESIGSDGFFLSRASLLGTLKETKELAPRYPMAFSIFNGVTLSSWDESKHKRDKGKFSSTGGKSGGSEEDGEGEEGVSKPDKTKVKKALEIADDEDNPKSNAAVAYLKESIRRFGWHALYGAIAATVVTAAKVAFSMDTNMTNNVALGDIPPKKAKKPESQGGKPDANPTPGEPSGDDDFSFPGDKEEKVGSDPTAVGKPGEPGTKPGEGGTGDNVDLPPLGDKAGDVSMEEVLCDLLRALGVDIEHGGGDEQQFKRNLYMGAMQKVHELTNKGMNKDDEVKAGEINKGNPPGAQPNPLVQQEQQPMYMSLEDVNKITDQTTKSIALSMYNDRVRLQAELDESKKTTNSLRDARLKEASDKRAQRVFLLGRVSPKVKADLEAMVALPSMAMSLGDGGSVIDPMDPTLSILEKGIGSLPALLTTASAALSVAAQPTDDDSLNEAEQDKLADDMARRMGASIEVKKAS